MNLKNKRVTILGGKRSGEALARVVVSSGGLAQISESGSSDAISGPFKEWAKDHNVAFEFNGHTEAFLAKSDIVVLSPGVRFDANIVNWIRTQDILILGEIEFAYQFCPKPVIAVTGSNGKTTVVTLIDKVLKASGKNSCLCGNVGAPFSDYVTKEEYDYFVVEVSSFQMESLLDINERPESIKGFKPLIAVVLNFSQNHLDRHKDMEDYFSAKMRIFLNQNENDYAVLNGKDEKLRIASSGIASQKAFFNLKDSQENPNYLAVKKVAEILGISESVCEEVFQEFKGVEHRLEWVRNLNGVDYINDSKSTTVEATRWALTTAQNPTLLICGGRDKNLDFVAIKDLVKEKVKEMFCIGEAREKLIMSFSECVSCKTAASLEEAVRKATDNAQKGDSVLLSPMCASFDMFDNFEHRGRVFKDIVNSLK